MTGSRRHWSVLSPPGHAAVDERRVAGHACLGSNAKPFDDAGAEAFEDDVGLLSETKHRFDSVRRLHVDGDRLAVAVEHIGRWRRGVATSGGAGAVDPQHVGAHVGKQHGGKWSGSDPGEFDDSDAVERTAHQRAPAAARTTRFVTTETIIGHSVIGMSCPMPSTSMYSQSGMSSAVC